MKNGSIAIAILVATCRLAEGHHSVAAIFDHGRIIEIEGVVRSVSLVNPHGRILLDVENSNGQVDEWHIETPAVGIMQRRGIALDFVQPGDRVAVAGAPSRRGRSEIDPQNILLPNGTEVVIGLYAEPYFEAGLAGNLAEEVYVDGEQIAAEALRAADGIFRVWSSVIGDPASFPGITNDYPYSEAGRQRLAEWDPLDNVFLRDCFRKSMPYMMVSPLPIEFVQQGEDIVLRLEEDDAQRVIHMSDDAIASRAYSSFGFSTGRWESANVLVVETQQLTAGYLADGGAPKSTQIRLLERFTLSDSEDRLDYRLTITDPQNYTESFDTTRYFVWRPEIALGIYECEENNASMGANNPFGL